MKRIHAIAVTACFLGISLLSRCGSDNSDMSVVILGNEKEKIVGSGNIKIKDTEVSD